MSFQYIAIISIKNPESTSKKLTLTAG